MYIGLSMGITPGIAVAGTAVAIWLTLSPPALSVLQSWFQGTITHSRHTRVITEAVAISLVVITIVLGAGVINGKVFGIFVGWIAFTLGALVQVLWLWLRSRNVIRAVEPLSI